MALFCIFLLFIILTILVYLFSAGGWLFLLGMEYLVTALREEDYRLLSKGGLKKASLDFLISITQEATFVFAACTSDSGHM